MNKKDFKYIIKRILIGVGIVFFVAFIKKCDVHAEELTDLHVNIFGNSCPISDYDYSYFEDINSFTLGSYNITFKYSPGTYTSQNTLLMLFKNQDSYIAYTANSINPVFIDSVLTTLDISYIDFTSTSANFYGTQNNLLYTSYTPLNFSQFLTYTTNSNNNFDFIVNDYDYYNYNCSDNIPDLYTNAYNTGNDFDVLYPSTYDLLGYLINNYEFVYSNIPVRYNGNTMNFLQIPDYYSEINMQDKQAVYFVPKNYSTIPTSQNSNGDTIIPFNYYYKGNFADGYFPLNDYSKHVFFLNNVVSRDDFLYQETWFPYSQVIDDETYDYYAYIIENDDIYSFSQYQDSIIYYDSRYFDYYVIDDMSSYSNTLSIIDKNGDSLSIALNINSSLKQEFKKGIQRNDDSNYIGNQIVHALDDNILGKYIDFITIPFNFLNSITDSTTCEPIEIPIPFVGGIIELPCMSSVLSTNVPAIYNILVIVVNGFLVYRITMRNIDTMTDVVKADDDKIEVVDL